MYKEPLIEKIRDAQFLSANGTAYFNLFFAELFSLLSTDEM